MTTYYELLEVSELASVETIRAAFRCLSKRHHPDNKKTGNAERFRLIAEAHECLTNEQSRKEYDNELKKSRTPKGGEKKETRKARGKAHAAQPQAEAYAPAFDPRKGVEAIFLLGDVVIRKVGVDPEFVAVYAQFKPDLERVALDALCRMAGAHV